MDRQVMLEHFEEQRERRLNAEACLTCLHYSHATPMHQK